MADFEVQRGGDLENIKGNVEIQGASLREIWRNTQHRWAEQIKHFRHYHCFQIVLWCLRLVLRSEQTELCGAASCSLWNTY